MRTRPLALVAIALLAAACGSTTPSVPASPGPASAAVVTPAPTNAPTLPLPSGATVALDPSLLAVIPATVGGTKVAQEPDSFTEATKDPAFVASIDRAVFVIAVSGSDLASGVVGHVRQGVYSDQMFADWRASYDDGACAQSSGVAAHAEETLAGRTTYITTCGGGLRVYHTYIASKGVIVSVFSTGTQDFGAQLMSGVQG